MSDDEIRTEIIKSYRIYLKRNPDPSGLEYYYNQIKNGAIKIDELSQILQNSPEHDNLRELNHGCIYTTYGTKMYLNKNDMVLSLQLSKNKVWEHDESNFIINQIHEGMSVVDIGANIGYHTILFSKLVGPNGRVIAIEPDPENFDLLMKNIQANQCKNVLPIKKAISDSIGKKKFFQSDRNKGDHRIIDFHAYEDDNIRKQIDVETVTLDSLIPKESSIHFMKIDIQGAEMLAIRGMKRILRDNSKMTILIEFWPYAIEKSGFLPSDMINTLSNHGFKISVLEKDGIKQLNSNFGLLHTYDPVTFINLICEK